MTVVQLVGTVQFCAIEVQNELGKGTSSEELFVIGGKIRYKVVHIEKNSILKLRTLAFL